MQLPDPPAQGSQTTDPQVTFWVSRQFHMTPQITVPFSAFHFAKLKKKKKACFKQEVIAIIGMFILSFILASKLT